MTSATDVDVTESRPTLGTSRFVVEVQRDEDGKTFHDFASPFTTDLDQAHDWCDEIVTRDSTAGVVECVRRV